MTDEQNPTGTPEPTIPAAVPEAVPDAAGAADAAYWRDYEALRGESVRVLTRAVRLTHPNPRQGEMDFADFLAHVLACVAANVGSTDRLTAGRPGSWEADLVQQLVCGTVGWELQDLTRYRTEPVVIHLNVNRLMIDTLGDLPGPPYETPFEREITAVIDRHEQLPEQEYDPDTETAEQEAVTARWAARYAAYAQEFTAAITAEAARIEGLQVPVTVEANTDPDASVGDGPEHPTEWDDVDPLVWRLWQAARQAVALPGVEDPA